MRRLPSDYTVQPSRVPLSSDDEFSDDLELAPLDIPEEGSSDLTMGSDGENNTTNSYQLPPRIAARFYRPSNTRRKSSAASSRRNSISSIHSGHSHHSHRAAQSGHVAHHLRRASILEDRKARLADRAAHAEKVRLRAAKAKAAARTSTNSEEKAIAAKQARERYLAAVAASCAEEVKRAKNVAEEMKRRREEEGRKLRSDMEEKLAEAERRREVLLDKRYTRRARGMSMPRPIDEKGKGVKKTPATTDAVDDAVAALRIQTAWRRRLRRKAVKEFLELGPSVEGVMETSFEKVKEVLADGAVLAATSKMLSLCGLMPDGQDETAVRTFLSGFLILGHPTQVMNTVGEQEQVSIPPSF
jgi:hypothetical protein